MSAPTLAQLQAEFKQYLFSGANEAVLADQIRGANNIDATRRLDVYRNAYHIRLHAALAQDFPALLMKMGEAAFGREMAAYLKVCPSTSPSVRYIGKQLPHYLANRNKPQLADLARLEWAVLKAFDAADASALSVAAMAHIPPTAWQDLHFEAHPSVSLLEVSGHVFDVWTAHRRQQPLPERQTAATVPLLVWRSPGGPAVRRLSTAGHTLLAAVIDGQSFAQACVRLALGTPPDAVAPRAARSLLDLLQRGCLANTSFSGP